MKSYKNFFKNKKITVMGLGVLGRGLGYTRLLAECGADLIVTDLKKKSELASSIKKLAKFKNIKFILEKHRIEDFNQRDMIIKSAGVPLDSLYIKEAQNNKIPVEMDASLFFKLAPGVIMIGITGTRGKSTTTALIYEILKHNEKFLKRKIYIGGNMRGVATLPLLKKVKAGDVVVAELDSWQLQGFGDSKISPHISVFTSFMPDHMNYYRGDMKAYFSDKANIFKYQKKDDFLVIRPGVKKIIPKNLKANVIIVKRGTFQEENKFCAVEVAKLFNIPKDKIERSLKKFKGVEGRLQYVKTVKGVKIYNDNNATTPQATMAGMETFGIDKKLVLIAGGADKNLELNNFVNMVNSRCKKIVLLPGTGTDKLKNLKNVSRVRSLKEAVKIGMKLAKKGDVLLFSPAFASFGLFKNEYDRGDQFMKIIKKIK